MNLQRLDFNWSSRPAQSARWIAASGALLIAAALPTTADAQYAYTVSDPLRGDIVASGIDHDFWSPFNYPGGSEPGFWTISPDGFELHSFSVYLGYLDPSPYSKWAMGGDFRISFHFESSTYPGGYGNRMSVNIYETVPTSPTNQCGALVYPSGFAGLWTGYSSPPTNTFYDPGYGESAHYLFVRSGDTMRIYRDPTQVPDGSGTPVFEANYLNPLGTFIFMMGTGNPNSGWMRMRDVVIETEQLIPCDGATEVPAKWATTTDADGDGVDDAQDQCPATPAGAVVNAAGCSIGQLAACDGDWRNHGEYVSAVVAAAQLFRTEGLIAPNEYGAIVSAAARSSCGQKNR
ncbi:hypothetical protein [Piscinibacter sakaiensis]|uniref:hypothetical protein n=1 Tax=Piscinibacter sakaiensis TaxID=1547922 RepID=UPI003AAD0D78